MTDEQEQQADASGQEADGMQLDEMEVDASSSRANQKVELDLDDAPFLEWSEDEEEEAQEAAQEETEEEASEEDHGESEPSTSSSRRKWLLVGSLSSLLLIGAALAILWMVRAPDLQTKQGSPPEAPPAPETAEKQPPQDKEFDFRPFWVEYAQGDRLRYLHFEFALGLESSRIAWEIKRKVPLLRDSIFYYLKNKGLAFLSEKENVEELKEDLRGVINQNLSQGSIKDILIQKYVVE